MSVTLEVSHPETSSVVSERHLQNMAPMSVTLEVSSLSRSASSRSPQPLNQSRVVFGRMPSSTAVTLVMPLSSLKSPALSSMPVSTLVTVRPSKASPAEGASALL